MKYEKVPRREIFRLFNTGALVLVSTISKNGKHNIAPIAWTCPAELDPPRILLCIDPAHQTFKNIKQTGRFAVSLPRIGMTGLVETLGSMSGKKYDKYSEFGVKYIMTKNKFRIPQGAAAYAECSAFKIFDASGVRIVLGSCELAAADARAFSKGRLLAEKSGGKLIHHLGGGYFTTYGKITRK